MFDLQLLTDEVKHGEVAVGALALSALACEDGLVGCLTQSDDGQVTASYGHSYRRIATADGRVVGVVYPVDPWLDVDGQRVGVALLQCFV